MVYKCKDKVFNIDVFIVIKVFYNWEVINFECIEISWWVSWYVVDGFGNFWKKNFRWISC